MSQLSTSLNSPDSAIGTMTVNTPEESSDSFKPIYTENGDTSLFNEKQKILSEEENAENISIFYNIDNHSSKNFTQLLNIPNEENENKNIMEDEISNIYNRNTETIKNTPKFNSLITEEYQIIKIDSDKIFPNEYHEKMIDNIMEPVQSDNKNIGKNIGQENILNETSQDHKLNDETKFILKVNEIELFKTKDLKEEEFKTKDLREEEFKTKDLKEEEFKTKDLKEKFKTKDLKEEEFNKTTNLIEGFNRDNLYETNELFKTMNNEYSSNIDTISITDSEVESGDESDNVISASMQFSLSKSESGFDDTPSSLGDKQDSKNSSSEVEQEEAEIEDSSEVDELSSTSDNISSASDEVLDTNSANEDSNEQNINTENANEHSINNENTNEQSIANKESNKQSINCSKTTDNEETLPETVTQLTSKDGSKVYLVGTAHFSQESQDDVVKTISMVKPHIIVLELCKSRTAVLELDEETILNESKSLDFSKIRVILKQHGKIQGILYILLLSVSAHITKELKMAPGGEFRAAIHEARRSVPHCLIQLGDRPIQVTLARALSSLSVWQKAKLMWHILASKGPISKEEVEKCKKKDFIEEMLAEMTGQFPGISEVFVKERDIYLTRSLQMAANPISFPNCQRDDSPRVVVGVVGIGHVAGIVDLWEKVTEDNIAAILEIPPPNLSDRIFKLTLKCSFYGIVTFGIYKCLPISAKDFVYSSISSNLAKITNLFSRPIN